MRKLFTFCLLMFCLLLFAIGAVWAATGCGGPTFDNKIILSAAPIIEVQFYPAPGYQNEVMAGNASLKNYRNVRSITKVVPSGNSAEVVVAMHQGRYARDHIYRCVTI